MFDGTRRLSVSRVRSDGECPGEPVKITTYFVVCWDGVSSTDLSIQLTRYRSFEANLIPRMNSCKFFTYSRKLKEETEA